MMNQDWVNVRKRCPYCGSLRMKQESEEVKGSVPPDESGRTGDEKIWICQDCHSQFGERRYNKKFF